MALTATRIRFDEAIAESLLLEMHRDPDLVVITASHDGIAGRLEQTFGPDRVIEVNAAGAGLVLAACGAAQEGLRVVCELGAAEAGPEGLDQIAELAAIYAAGLDPAPPVTVRLAWGNPLTAGGAAAADPLAWLIGAEGIKVLAPATAADAKGLTLAAIRDPGPVCVLEHADLLAQEGAVPEGAHTVEIGRARLAREGSRLTILCHGTGVPIAEAAADRVGDGVELIDLRTLQPLDLPAVLTSVRKTGRALLVEADRAANRITAQLAAALTEHAFEQLDAPPRRIRLGSAAAGAHPAGDERVRHEDVVALEEACRELDRY